MLQPNSSRTHPDAVGIIIANAIAADPKRWRTMNPSPLNPDSLDSLFDLLANRQVNYVLVGGIAMLNYVDGRNTQDIDFLIQATDLPRLPELEIVTQDQDFARATYGSQALQIDLLLSNNRLFESVLSLPQFRSTASFAGREIPCISPEGLTLLKLYALPSLYRQGQFQRANLYEGDLSALKIAFPSIDLQYWVQQLKPHLLSSDLSSLTDICNEINARASRLGGNL